MEGNRQDVFSYLCGGTAAAVKPTPNALTGATSSAALNPTWATLTDARATIEDNRFSSYSNRSTYVDDDDRAVSSEVEEELVLVLVLVSPLADLHQPSSSRCNRPTSMS
jgi:hypothetical protein